jgi:hypothetical protein
MLSLRTLYPIILDFNTSLMKNFQKRTDPAKLFNVQGNEAVIVVNWTYLYIQKSSDYRFLRRSYSMHKFRPLIKPMMVVGTDGCILDSLGPYLAHEKNNNDGSITKNFMKTNEASKSWFQGNDHFIVDRGIRDSVSYLQDC